LALKYLIEVFAEELYFISDGAKECSTAYKQTQECYQWLETEFKPILRKLLPGPRAYKTVEDMDSDVEKYSKDYEAAIPNEYPMKNIFLLEFMKRLEDYREKLCFKLRIPYAKK
jgi:hypothetical protein